MLFYQPPFLLPLEQKLYLLAWRHPEFRRQPELAPIPVEKAPPPEIVDWGDVTLKKRQKVVCDVTRNRKMGRRSRDWSAIIAEYENLCRKLGNVSIRMFCKDRSISERTFREARQRFKKA